MRTGGLGLSVKFQSMEKDASSPRVSDVADV